MKISRMPGAPFNSPFPMYRNYPNCNGFFINEVVSILISLLTTTSLFLRCLLFTGNCFTFTFSCTAIGTSTLTTNRQPFTVAKSTVTSDIEQTLNACLNLTAQLTFYLKFIGDDITDCCLFSIVPIIYLFVVVNLCFIQNISCCRTTDTKNI